MSVMIKNQDMPQNCDACPMRQINLRRCQVTHKPMNSETRPSWCPLVEVPEVHLWIPVTEWLPEVGTQVLLSRPKQGKKVVEPGEKDAGDWWRVYGTRVKKVDAWMPMPEPYEEES